MSGPIAITLGDPAGIGSEIIARTYRDLVAAGSKSLPLCIGPEWAVRMGCRIARVDLPVVRVESVRVESVRVESVRVESITNWVDCIPILDISTEAPSGFEMGRVHPVCGHASVRAVETATRLALAGDIDAIVTAPLNKESVHAAGYHGDIGHQEIFARLTHSTRTATLLMTEGLWVAHLSTHKSLADAVRFVRKSNIVDKARLTLESLRHWGLAEPRLAVAALNPHGGEGGLLGREEIEEVAPAVDQLRSEGHEVSGPYPADSLFNRAIAGEFDAVLALYHDQGHIAIKVHNFHDSVTVTMGIPFIRTSVDHGTAFDIAGRGVADHRGLLSALRMATTLRARELSAPASR